VSRKKEKLSMRKTIGLVAATFVVAALLAVSAGTAAALRSISLSPAGSITATSRAVTFRTSSGEVICEITLSGTVGTAIPKARGSSVGSATARSGRCRGPLGVEVILTWLNAPYPIIFKEWLGELPRIEGLLLEFVNVQMLVEVPILRLRCLYAGNVPALGPVVGGVFRQAIPLPEAIIPLFRQLVGSETCPREAQVTTTFNIVPEQNVRLV
jgi:hypothetical protein